MFMQQQQKAPVCKERNLPTVLIPKQKFDQAQNNTITIM